MLEHTHMVPESMHLVDIIETFKRTNASYLQVVDQRRALAGIISFRDVRAVLQEEDLGHLIIARGRRDHRRHHREEDGKSGRSFAQDGKQGDFTTSRG